MDPPLLFFRAGETGRSPAAKRHKFLSSPEKKSSIIGRSPCQFLTFSLPSHPGMELLSREKSNFVAAQKNCAHLA